jgi:hemoglobin
VEDDGRTIYEVVGGDAFFADVVERFYHGVVADPVLRSMYPDDLTDSKRNLTLFLVQYWGGPMLYNDERGHPRLRMRHAPFPIDEHAAASWYRCMYAAVRGSVADADLDPQVEAKLLAYFDMAASALVNRAE